ncbi:PREDICTED: kelch-like protein 5 [Bactrocera latifrons]|uniref:kelch-like protein 5 n=1 Tax=Bactrocera latifrons TaxID=174628 RepID=UPI0008DCCFD5|nr:PREDICTED: kelch-like protein 5 [Bactrocera latifrons]
MASSIGQSKDQSISFAIQNFAQLINSAEFLDYTPEILQQIVSADELNIDCEVDVFQALMRWYEHDKENRRKDLSQLIPALKLGQFDAAFIEEYIKPLFNGDQVPAKALSLLSESTVTDNRLKPDYLKARNERTCRLLTLNDVKKLKPILRYNTSLNKWQKCFEFKFIDYSYAVFHHKNYLLFVGGRSRGTQRNDTIKCLDLHTFEWQQMSAMSQRRDDLCAVLLSGKIYAFGGHDGDDPFDTAEMYDIATNQWQLLPSMPYHRYGAGATVYDGKIYIFGGLSINCRPLSAVECYDPLTNTWISCCDMHGARGWPGVAVLDSLIYIIGGYNEGYIAAAECFDPQLNAWREIAPLNIARFGICAIVVGNRIWALGGHDAYTVEQYDRENDKWIEKTPLPVYGIFSCVEVPNHIVNKLQSCYAVKENN